MDEKADLPVELAPGLWRLTAPNPSPMTASGTNSYVLLGRTAAVIDPGPAIPAHLEALSRLIDGRAVDAILVTHAHLDHSDAARPLADATGAPILGYGPPEAGRRPEMARLAAAGLAGGGEGVDAAFAPDRRIGEDDVVQAGGRDIGVLHTPGHFAGHISFRLGDDVLTGDTVMGWSTSLVSPPDGSVADFVASCERLAGIGALRFLPGHGAPVDDPAARALALARHRRAREAAILAALDARPRSVGAIRAGVYGPLAPGLDAAADRNVFAHLVDLVTAGRATALPRLSPDALYRRP